MKKTTLCCFLVVFHVNGQDSKSRVDELLAMDLGNLLKVNIATGTPVEVSQAPSIASVISSQQIRLMGARNIVDVFKSIPGLHVGINSSFSAPSFWFRGITSTFSPHALVMVNGVSLKSAVRGDNHVVWAEFPIHAVERVEIIRGPGSALYGADAFSGVINIITKKGSDIKNNEVGGTVGSFDTYNTWFNYGFEIADWSVGLNFEFTKSDGFEQSINADAQTVIDSTGDALFNAGVFPSNPPDASLAPGNASFSFEALDLWISAENKNWDVNLGIQERNDIGVGYGIIEALDRSGRLAGYKNILKVALKPQDVAPDITMQGEVSYYRSSQEVESDILLFPKGALFGAFPDGLIGNPEWQEDTYKAEGKVNFTGVENHLFTLGGGYIWQDVYEVSESKNFNADLSPKPQGLVDVSGTDEVFLPTAKRENVYLYMQDIFQLAPDWTLTAGLRYDDYTDFGSTTNPRVALVWNISEGLTSKLLYGRAFRAPAFAETLTVNNPLALGNPNLTPEVIETTELAINYQIGDHFLFDINVFEYQIKDFINFIPDANATTATAQNLGRRDGKGLETELKYTPFEQLSYVVNYAYVSAKDKVLNTNVGIYPNHKGYFRVNWAYSEVIHYHLQATLVGERERVLGDIRPPLSGYQSVDMGIRFRSLEMRSDFELLVNNLFDEDIREPSAGTTDYGATSVNIPDDLPMAGRSVYLRLSKQF
jgi:iron complex outermembrane receptor protein